jgi:hypothetical protein
MWPPKQPAGVAYDIAACGFRHSRAAKRRRRRMVYSASAELRRWTVSSFANAAQFAGSRPFESASGVSANSAIVDPQGRVIGQVMTGGIIGPRRYELAAGTILFRWGAKNAAPMDIAQREWWIEKLSFEKLLSFANAYEISVGMATRVLCLVPPEWSDLGTLVRAVTRRPFLAYRGLGSRRRRRRLPLEGLPRRRPGALEDDATSSARVHQALPAARIAQGLPSHPPLRARC